MNTERKTLSQSVTPLQMAAVLRRARLRRRFAPGTRVQHIVTGKHFEVHYLLAQEELVGVGLPDGKPDFDQVFPCADLKPVN
jgi:hypothetical protein